MIKNEGSGRRVSRATRPDGAKGLLPLKPPILICLSIFALPCPRGIRQQGFDGPLPNAVGRNWLLFRILTAGFSSGQGFCLNEDLQHTQASRAGI